MKTAESAIKELISRIENAKVESRNPNNRTKRTGEYRIGLSQAINLAHDVIAELAEELASHPCPVEYPEAIIANFQPTSPMSAEQVEELGYYYPLFKFFSDEHGLSLLDSQLQDVIHECKKFIEPASPSVKADGWVSVDGKITPHEQYFKETGAKTIWKITNHTHTDEYVEWIKNYAKNSDSIAAKMIREFSNKNGEQPLPAPPKQQL